MRRATAGLHFRQAGKNSTLIAAAIPPGLRCAPVHIHSGGRCQTRKEEGDSFIILSLSVSIFS